LLDGAAARAQHASPVLTCQSSAAANPLNTPKGEAVTSMIDNRFFVAFIRFINYAVLDFLPKFSSTLRKWVINEYKHQKEIKKETIRRSRSRISISFDTWTAPFAKKHIISVIAHFVYVNWE